MYSARVLSAALKLPSYTAMNWHKKGLLEADYKTTCGKVVGFSFRNCLQAAVLAHLNEQGIHVVDKLQGYVRWAGYPKIEDVDYIVYSTDRNGELLSDSASQETLASTLATRESARPLFVVPIRQIGLDLMERLAKAAELFGETGDEAAA